MWNTDFNKIPLKFQRNFNTNWIDPIPEGWIYADCILSFTGHMKENINHNNRTLQAIISREQHRQVTRVLILEKDNE